MGQSTVTHDFAADDERVFLIDETLKFRFGTLDGDPACSWNDQSGDEGDLWEFVSSKVSRIREAHLRPSLCKKRRTAFSKWLFYTASTRG